MSVRHKKETMLTFVLQSIRPFIWLIIGQMFTAIICAIDISVRPYIIKRMLNALVVIQPEQSFEKLGQFAGLYIAMALLLFCVFRMRDWIWLRFAPNLKKRIGLHMMDLLAQQPHYFFQHHFAGSLSNKIGDVLSSITRIVKISIDEFFSHLIAICVAIYTVSHVASFFAIALSIWVIIFVTTSIAFSGRAAYFADRAAEQKSVVIGNIVDVLSNMMSVRLFATKNVEHMRLEEAMQMSVKADQQRNWFYLKMHAFQGISFIIFQGLCFWWLIKGFQNSIVTPGDFALILGINVAIVNCLWNISKDMRDFSENLGDLTQGLRIILLPIELEDIPNAQPLIIRGGEIVFDQVSFCYKDAGQFFEDKTVTILPGQKVGLVGYSGSGKSTFIHLILRLFEVTQGRILIDGQNIAHVTQESLHKEIAIIPQEPSLFHRTIMENIRYGRPDATDEQVIEAAKRAHAHEFIMSQQQGYFSLVGERGAKLSGGQRQRIAIARAILKNAPILILDEATSQLDSVTEGLIQESLWELMQDKTTLVVAHRLSTLLQMDRILVFDQGNIIEDGTHQELLAQQGLYHTLWQAQIGGMLPESESM